MEWAEFCGDYYGTPKKYVEESIKEGKNIILEIEVQGALQIKKILPRSVLIFVMPPTVEELRHRLIKRGTETEDLIEKRIKRSNEEIALISNYDYVVVNYEIEDAVRDILAITRAEQLKTDKNTEAIKKFKGEI
ncbi:Guanylate kinase [bioreactor metagenome]|uniref:Guanylate kinase n=1 Tax=bioreactor metagenome TaxID=1076179 RepID=A0A645I4T7_9ZZZZ